MTDPLDTAVIRDDVFATADRMFRQITAKYSDESRAALYAVASATAIPLVVEIVELRKRIAELEAEQQNGEWEWGWMWPWGSPEWTHSEAVARQAAAARRPPATVLRRWIGPPTPISDTTGGQQ